MDLVNAKNENIDKCENEIVLFKTEVRKLKNELDDTDSYQRKDTLLKSKLYSLEMEFQCAIMAKTVKLSFLIWLKIN